MANILTIDQVKQAIYADDDFDSNVLERYAKTASAFINQKTGYDFAAEVPVNDLAVQCAIMYVQQMHFANTKFNKEYDFVLGINSLLIDLQIIAKEKLGV